MTNYNKKFQLIPTADGSFTLFIPELNESYHSLFGALMESKYVFIAKGLEKFFSDFSKDVLNVGEAGFGTGLNAWLTMEWAIKNKQKIIYETYEKFPLPECIIKTYAEKMNLSSSEFYLRMHDSKWNIPIEISPYFTLIKMRDDFRKINKKNHWHVFYYDAFSPRVQPELWTLKLIKKIYDALKMNGIFVTYSAKGSVRRNLLQAGFRVEKLPGPPGKREMLRGIKF